MPERNEIEKESSSRERKFNGQHIAKNWIIILGTKCFNKYYVQEVQYAHGSRAGHIKREKNVLWMATKGLQSHKNGR